MRAFLVLFLLFCFKSEACPKAFHNKDKDFDTKIVLKNARWSGLTLSGYELAIAPMSTHYERLVNEKIRNQEGAIFEGGYFPNSTFSYINARKGKFSNTDFSYSTFRDVILEKTIFINSNSTNVYWVQVNARGMDATGAIFKGSTFDKVDFSDSILTNTDFTKVTFREGVKFNENTNIEGAKFLGAIFEDKNLVEYLKSKGFKVEKRVEETDDFIITE